MKCSQHTKNKLSKNTTEQCDEGRQFKQSLNNSHRVEQKSPNYCLIDELKAKPMTDYVQITPVKIVLQQLSQKSRF